MIRSAPAQAARSVSRAILTSSIAALLLAGMAHGVEWSGTQTLILGVDPGGDDVDLLADTVVTLDGAGGTLLENVILNLGTASITTLTVNNAAGPARALAANATLLGTDNGKSVVVAGSADFRAGALADGGFANMELVKNGGTGELILDHLTNDLDGATLRVVDGTVSIFGGGGTASPIDSLVQAIRLEGTGAKLRLGTLSAPGTTFINNLVVHESGTLEHTAASRDTLSGLVVLAAEKTLTANVTNGSLVLSGSVLRSGNSHLTKAGAGTLTLAGFGSGTGLTTVNEGTLQFAISGALYSGAAANWIPANITVASGATMALNVGGTNEFTSANVATLLDGTHLGASTVSTGLKSGAVLGLDTTNAAGGVFAFSSPIANPNAGANVLHLAKLGTGTLNLGGTNTYTGTTTVQSGALQFAKLSSLYNGAAANWIPANIHVSSGATLGLNVGGTNEFASTNLATLLDGAHLGASTISTGLKSGAILGLDTTTATGGTFTYNSPIANPNGGANVLHLTKLGTGTLNLGGMNTYSGTTTISAGTLVLGSGGSINNSSGISLASGATYNVSAVAGYTLGQTLSAKGSGTANVSGAVNAGARTIDLQDGANIGTLAFGGTLTLSGATLRFDLGTSASDRITIGGVITLSGTNIINVSALASAGSLTIGSQAYTLITATSGLASSLFNLSSPTLTIGTTTYALSLNGTPSAQYLGVAFGSAAVPTTYTLTTSASAQNIHAITGTSTITTTLTNTGTTGASSDSLAYTTLGVTVLPPEGVTLSAPQPGGTIAANAGGTANATAVQNFSSTTAGSYTVTASGGTVTNAALGGGATLQGSIGTDTINVFRLAAPNTLGPITFNGNHHVGDIVTAQTISLTNTATADGFSEKLDAAITGSTGGAVASGSIALLAAGSSNTTALQVEIDTSTVGAKSGIVTVGLTSNGTGTSGLGTTGLASQVVTVNAGSVFRLAQPSQINETLTFSGNHHLGDVVPTQAVSLTNEADADGFSEKLDAVFIDMTGAATGSGSVSLLAAGSSNATSLQVGIDTSTVGLKNGTVTVGLTSNGTGTSGLGMTGLAPQMITVNGGSVFRLAAPGAIGNAVTLPNVHVGGTFATSALAITNTAAADGFSEGLDATTGISDGASATGSFSNVIGTSTAISVGLGNASTATAGAKTGTVHVFLTSSGANSGLVSTPRETQSVTLSSGVFRLAAPDAIGNAVTLPNVHVGGTFGSSAMVITNTAANDGFSEGLNAGTTNLTGAATAAGTITNLLGTSNAISVSLGDTATAGAKSGTVDVVLTSNGTNSGLANTTLTPQTVSVSGSVFRLAAASTGSVVTFSGNHHVGDMVAAQSLSLTNTAAADGFSEKLDAAFTGSTGGATGTGSVSLLAPMQTNTTGLLVGLDTSSAGAKSGTLTLGLTSNGTGTSGLGTSALPVQVITVNAGSVFRLAAPATNMAGGQIDLGRVHANGTFGTAALSVTNAAPAGAFTEGLNAALGATGGAASHNNGTIINLAGGATDGTSLVVGLGGAANTGAAGAVTGTITLNLVSYANEPMTGLSDTVLTPETVSVTGFVYSGLGVWNLDGGGSWADIGNWQTNGGVPGLDAGFTSTDTATFGSSATSASTTVNLNGASPSLKALAFDNIGQSYTLNAGSGGILKLDNGAGTATVISSNGSHAIGAPIRLDSDAAISIVNPADELTVSGNLTQTGTHGLTKTGSGTLNLTGTQGYDTLTANAGATNVDGAIGSGGSAVIVNNAGTTLKFGSVSQTLASLSIGAGATVTFSSGTASLSAVAAKTAGQGDVAVVPEPGTLGLLMVGVLGILGRRRRTL